MCKGISYISESFYSRSLPFYGVGNIEQNGVVG